MEDREERKAPPPPPNSYPLPIPLSSPTIFTQRHIIVSVGCHQSMGRSSDINHDIRAIQKMACYTSCKSKHTAMASALMMTNPESETELSLYSLKKKRKNGVRVLVLQIY